jgi:hypothetical protein
MGESSMPRLLPLACLPALAALSLAAAANPTCPTITDSTARLACFDAAYPPRVPSRVLPGSASPAPGPSADSGPATNPGPAEAPAAAVAGWQSDSAVSENTGTKDVFVWVDALETVECEGQTFRPSLFLRCMDNETAVLLVTDCQVRSEGVGGLVSYKVDDGPTRLRTFVERTDFTALGLWDYGAATPFLRDIKGGTTMTMRFTAQADKRPRDLTFDIDGVDAAMAQVDTACGR